MSKVIDSATRVVTVDVLIKMSKNDPMPQAKTWTLDYSGVSIKDLLDRASRTDVITLQARYRNKPFTQMEFDVATDISAHPAGTSKDPKAEVVRHLARMSPEEKAAFLREIMGE